MREGRKGRELLRWINFRRLLGWMVLFLVLGVTGCKKDPKVEFIQGLWYNLDAHLANIPAESAQVTKWEFDNSYFEVYSCCFVESAFSGNYSVAERKEGELTLDLFNLSGQNGGVVLKRSDTMFLVLEINTDDDTLMINNSGPYSRISP